MNMWHSIQMLSTQWDFMSESHRSLLYCVMDQRGVKIGKNIGNDIVCIELFEIRIIDGHNIRQHK